MKIFFNKNDLLKQQSIYMIFCSNTKLKNLEINNFRDKIKFYKDIK